MATVTSTALPSVPFYVGYFPEIALVILFVPIIVVLLIGYKYDLISFRLSEVRTKKANAKKKGKGDKKGSAGT